MIRVLLADDHALVRQGMKQLISCNEAIMVTGEASSGEEVLRKLGDEAYDILLLDVTMPGLGGAELISAICRCKAHPPILILTMHDEPRLARLMIQAGAKGFLTKDCPPEMLEEAIGRVAAGGRYIQPDMTERLVFDRLYDPLTPDALTSRELDILRMLARGLRITDVASELSLSSRTVSSHKTRMMQKLDIANDADLIRYADAHGLKW